jgi:type IV secretion system protein VirB6
MTIVCAEPDAGEGVAVLLGRYLDCQARALGENGFQALAGGALGTSLLSGLLTIFIGIVGYRFLLGATPNLREGAGWTVRVGLVLALLTAWPAFQTLVYNVAVDGPNQLAGILLPASGLPAEELSGRVQSAYDTIRLGSIDSAEAQPPAATATADPEGAQPAGRLQFQPALPRTASLFVISTSGFVGALRIGVGFLLAIAPLPIMCLLFDSTLGVFSGWVRALSGLALATLSATIATALGLVAVEAQLARVQALRFGGSLEAVDPQAVTVIVMLFALVTLVTVFAAMKMTSAFKLPRPRVLQVRGSEGRHEQLPQFASIGSAAEPRPVDIAATATAGRSSTPTQPRISSIVESLSSSVRREQRSVAASGNSGPGGALPHVAGGGRADEVDILPRGATRRGLGRRTRRGALRDGKS